MNECMICHEPLEREGDMCETCLMMEYEFPQWEEYFEQEENEIKRIQ